MTSFVFDLRILLKSSVRGSDIILINPLLIKQRAGCSFASSHNLTHSPHLIHFAFSNIRPVLILIFFSIGEFINLPLGSLTDNSSAIFLSLQLSTARQSQCMQLSDSKDADSRTEISLTLVKSFLHSFNHSVNSFVSSLPIREVYRFEGVSDLTLVSGGYTESVLRVISFAALSFLICCETNNCMFFIETGV